MSTEPIYVWSNKTSEEEEYCPWCGNKLHIVEGKAEYDTKSGKPIIKRWKECRTLLGHWFFGLLEKRCGYNSDPPPYTF